MRDTMHCLTADEPDQARIRASIQAMIGEVQKYVPGYTLKNGPVFDGRRVSVYMEVAGLGDYLPKYAGNLDIMTAAALRTGRDVRPPARGMRHESSRHESHAARHVPARRHAPEAAPDLARADGRRRDRAGRGGRAAHRGHARRRPGRRLGQLRLPGSHRRGVPARGGAADEARASLGAAAARHRHRRSPADGGRLRRRRRSASPPTAPRRTSPSSTSAWRASSASTPWAS